MNDSELEDVNLSPRRLFPKIAACCRENLHGISLVQVATGKLIASVNIRVEYAS